MEERNVPPFPSDQRAESAPDPWLNDGVDTRRALQGLACRVTAQRLWHEDLVQEALLHWWQVEQQSPGQSRAWYLRSCEFHLRNRLRQGRSIDSPKRRHGAASSLSNADELDVMTGPGEFEDMVVHDLETTLREWLTPAERGILACLKDGLSARATARRLNISHTGVLKNRRRIAGLVLKLEPDLRLPVSIRGRRL